ncbi:MAG: response regulator [Blastocatellia bacterium]|nr:response regulator [Blastocatellia bacterium]
MADSNQVDPPEGSTTLPREVFERIFDLYAVLDGKSRILQLHGAIFSRTSVDPSPLSGQQFSETVYWQTSENNSRMIAASIVDALRGKSVKTVLDFRISAKEHIPIELSFVPGSEPDNKARVYVFGEAVTVERTKNEQASIDGDRLLSAADNAEIGLWFWDFTNNRIFSTPRCNELLGLPPYGTISHEALLNAVHPDDREYVDEFLRESRASGTKYEEEFRVVYPDNSVDWISVEGKSTLGGSDTATEMMGIIRKVTDEKRAATELAKVYDREKRARDEAVEANRAKDFFLAFVSHELRAPLNAILGWSKILLTKKVDDETRKNALETIERSARIQAKLINDLVDSARVASGKLRLEYRPTNLFDLIHGSCQAHSPAADARNIDLKFTSEEKEVVVFGDANRLQQVFGNIIANAIKFTPDGGKVHVSMRVEDKHAITDVVDNGRGISPEVMPNIFRQFSQGGPAANKNSAGLGLGLSIAKVLAERHGGVISAESEGSEKGSKFTVSLPLTKPSAATMTESSAEIQSTLYALKDRFVMVVEDDPDSREVLQLFLEGHGAKVKTATDGLSARKLLADTSNGLPDIIISDLAMPEEDGYTLLSNIRALDAKHGGMIPAIALSAFATAESRERAFRAGFQKYLTKPYEPDSLIAEIQGLVSVINENGVH